MQYQLNNKKFILFSVFWIMLFVANFCFSAGLEVKNYPTSQTGIVLADTNTPVPILLKYIFDMGIFLGFAAAFYSLTYAGVQYLISSAKPEYLSSAKDRVFGAISGILILAMIYLILTTLNPQLQFFRLGTLDTIPPPQTQKTPGVYFYKSTDCSGEPKITSTSINDFGIDLNNQINSVLIVNKPGDSFISTMYSSPGLFGKCQDADPNDFNCQQVANIASSASVHIYDFEPDSNPKNDGVYFYRKPFYKKDGGFLKISNTQIQGGGFFGAELKNLTFQDVPIEDKICEKWDNDGNCTQKTDPTLAGKEISSIKIAGSYIVYFVYDNPNNPETYWKYCQEFPIPDDTNKEGPKQFKWEKSLNQPDLPNWVYIYPVK